MAEAQRKSNQPGFVDARDRYQTPSKRSGFAANTNRAPEYEYPTISGDFNERQYSRGGIQNVEIETTQRSATKHQYRSNLERLEHRAFIQQEKNGDGVADEQPEAAKKATRSSGLLGKKSRFSKKVDSPEQLAKRLVGRMSITVAMTWTGFLNLIIFPVGIITLIALGATTIVASIPGAETAIDAVIWFFGSSEFDIWALAFVFLIIYWLLVFTSFFNTYLQLKLTGVEPIHGTAAPLKTAVFVGAIIISAIPGSTFIPWISLWLLVLQFYPN